MRWLVDEAYPDAGLVRLVLDNLNTHKMGYPQDGYAKPLNLPKHDA